MQRAEQVQDLHDEQDRPDYAQAPACPPSGIAVIAAAGFTALSSLFLAMLLWLLVPGESRPPLPGEPR